MVGLRGGDWPWALHTPVAVGVISVGACRGVPGGPFPTLRVCSVKTNASWPLHALASFQTSPCFPLPSGRRKKADSEDLLSLGWSQPFCLAEFFLGRGMGGEPWKGRPEASGLALALCQQEVCPPLLRSVELAGNTCVTAVKSLGLQSGRWCKSLLCCLAVRPWVSDIPSLTLTFLIL